MASRILLADDSPHAQRMGERILREEGYEVVTVTDGETALLRLSDVDPDLLLADVLLPGRSGYELCRFVKQHPRYRHVGVILVAGLLEPVDEEEARLSGSDGVLKKPFEASAMLASVRPLLSAARAARHLISEVAAIQAAGSEAAEAPAAPPPAAAGEPDPELVAAAVTLALDRAMPALVAELTEQVLQALKK
jgi:CheY-like chemotaxis protein